MNAYDKAVAEAEENVNYTLQFERDDPLEGDCVMAAIGLKDGSGNALLVEVGAGARGAFATVRAFKNGSACDPSMVADVGHSLMVIVDEQ